MEEIEDDICSAFESRKGLLQLVGFIIRFARVKNKKQLAFIADKLGRDKSILNALPQQLRSYLPVDTHSLGTLGPQKWLEMSDRDIAECFSERCAGLAVQIEIVKEPECLLENLRKCVEGNIYVVFILLGMVHLNIHPLRHHEEYNEFFSGEELFSAVVDAAIKNPSRVARFPYIWGQLLRMSGARKQELLAALRSSAPSTPGDWMSVGNFESFMLDLPSDASLLPSIFKWMVYSTSTLVQYADNSVSQKSARSADDWVKEFVGCPSELLPIMKSEMQVNEVRSVAAMMYLLHPSSDKDHFEECAAAITSLYSSELQPLYLRAAGVSLLAFILEGRPFSIQALEDLLERSRQDFSSRFHFDPMLEKWRQISKAPIHEAKTRGVWA